MSKSKQLLISILFFIAGIFVGNFLNVDVFLLFCFILFFGFLVVIFWKNKQWRTIFVFIVFFFLGFARFIISLPDFEDPTKIYHYNNQEINFSGRVVKVDERINHQKLTVDVSGKLAGKVLVSASLYPKYIYGDALQINCNLKRPEKFNDFDYEKYLARYDIYSVCSFASISDVIARESRQGDRRPAYRQAGNLVDLRVAFLKQINQIKSHLSTTLNKSIPEPQVSILQAMVLGNRRGISQDWLDKFSSVGISHIIAISGMHIAIIVIILMWVIIWLGVIRSKAFWVALAGLVFYIILIGAPASAVRAGIMAIMILYAQKLGRLNSSAHAIVVAGFVMLLLNPKLLLSDIGFQLSFLAVLGIIYIYPILEEKCRDGLLSVSILKNSFIKKITDIILITLSAQIITLPLIIFYFHKLSLVSILANVLILPIIPFIMVWGIAGAIIGAIYLPLGKALGFISYIAVEYILKVTDFLSQAPFAHLEIENMGIFVVVVLYGLIGWWIYLSKKSGG